MKAQNKSQYFFLVLAGGSSCAWHRLIFFTYFFPRINDNRFIMSIQMKWRQLFHVSSYFTVLEVGVFN